MNKNRFYEMPFEEFTFVSGDIETTGFYDDDIITAFTLECEGEYVSWLNADGDSVNPTVISNTIEAESDHEVDVRVCPDDGALLNSVRQYVTSEFDLTNTIFVFYNGEQWHGGFDLSFIRSVCLRTGAEFPFADAAYLDLMPLFDKHDRFNLTHIDPNPDINDLFNKGPLKKFADHIGAEYANSWNKPEIVEAVKNSEEFDKHTLKVYCEENGVDAPEVNPSDLVGVYNRIARLVRQRDDEEFVRQWLEADCDPFGPDESEKAVSAYHNREYSKLVLHNVADVHKTSCLVSLLPEMEGALSKDVLKPTIF